MKRAAVLFLVAALPAAAALAGDFDGTRPLICAAAEARECSSGDECADGLPADFLLPTFMRVDVEKKIITGPRRMSKVQYMEKGEKQILLQGTEFGYAWTLALNTDDGGMSGSITNREGVYAIFGNCTPL